MKNQHTKTNHSLWICFFLLILFVFVVPSPFARLSISAGTEPNPAL
jgi:hypothetical protein